MKKSSLTVDDYSRGLLISIISKAVIDDKTLTPDDIEKLRELKKQLQDN